MHGHSTGGMLSDGRWHSGQRAKSALILVVLPDNDQVWSKPGRCHTYQPLWSKRWSFFLNIDRFGANRLICRDIDRSTHQPQEWSFFRNIDRFGPKRSLCVKNDRFGPNRSMSRAYRRLWAAAQKRSFLTHNDRLVQSGRCASKATAFAPKPSG